MTVYNEWVSFKKAIHNKDNPMVLKGDKFLGGLGLMDCHNMIFEEVEIAGYLELNSSNPEIGLKNIWFNKFNLHDANYGGSYKKLMFMGGSNIDGITFSNGTVIRCIAGTHAMYFTGGHWGIKDKEGNLYPPVRNITINNVSAALTPGGRFLIQFNGRFDGVIVSDCLLPHGQLGAISSIGVHNGIYRNNTIYGCNRTPIVIFDYASHWASQFNWFQTEEDIQAWLESHWPNQNIDIYGNTIIVGPHRFSTDIWHKGDDPTKNFPAIEINNAVHSGFDYYDKNNVKHTVESGWEYPNKNIVIDHNKIWTPNEKVIDIKHTHETSETMLLNNEAWSEKTGTPWVAKCGQLKACYGNKVKEPHFIQGLPIYDFIDMDADPTYDWSKFQSAFNPKQVDKIIHPQYFLTENEKGD